MSFQVHRVVEPTDGSGGDKWRRSTSYFINPDDDVIVECLDGSNKYPPVNAAEYVWWKGHHHNPDEH